MRELNKFEQVLINLTEGGQSLEREEWDCIYLFSMLYAYGESIWEPIGTGIGHTGDVADWLLSSNSLDHGMIDNAFGYFSQRYTTAGVANHRFDDLFPDRQDRSGGKPPMKILIEKMNPTTKEKLSLCLKVLHRLRNNLFHGEKWKINFRDQFDNFNHSNMLLTMLLEKTKNNLWHVY
ncbi:TPA: hypothetical protein R8G81_000619 [Citrobacter youngae]|nr:hypothetical protein [Citrobacter youngae]